MQLPDRRRVRAADDGATEGAKPDQAGETEPAVMRDATEFLFLARRQTDVEALGEAGWAFLTKWHARPPSRGCEKR